MNIIGSVFQIYIYHIYFVYLKCVIPNKRRTKSAYLARYSHRMMPSSSFHASRTISRE